MNSERDPLDTRLTDACPSPELLIAYLGDEVSSDEQSRIDAHLDLCELCLAATVASHARLRQGEIREALPMTFLPQPTAALPPQNAAGPAGVRPSHGPRRPTRVVRRLPVPPTRFLVPMALAAGLTLMILGPASYREDNTPLTRSIEQSSTVKVTAHRADVRTDPSLHATVVAQLTRGAVVEVAAQEREWYRVRLESGSEGWIEQRACR